MNSSDHPSAYGYQPEGGSGPRKEWQPVNEETLHSGEVEIERKSFRLTLKENPRGRFLRITEYTGSKRGAIIIPADGLKDFQKLLADMIEASATTPPKLPD